MLTLTTSLLISLILIFGDDPLFTFGMKHIHSFTLQCSVKTNFIQGCRLRCCMYFGSVNMLHSNITKISMGLTVSVPPIGTSDLSFIDPVVVGRDVFSVTMGFVDGLVGYIQDMLCTVLDTVLETAKGSYTLSHSP